MKMLFQHLAGLKSVGSSLASRRLMLKSLSSVVLVSSFNALWSPLRARANMETRDDIESLRNLLKGTLITGDDEDYELHRLALVWQMLKPKRYPAMIVQAESEVDVQHAVKFARRHNYQVSVRCGGHNYVSSFLVDGTLVIDVSRLQGITIDPATRSATIGPGVHSRILAEELGKHDFAFPVAHPGRIAMGGYLLGGGQGWNSQAWGGAACLSVDSVDVVTADGQVVTANQKQNTDLYWAARGAGPCFFGVVTSFTLKLFDAPRSIVRSTYIWPLDAAADASAWAHKQAKQMPEFVESWFFLTAASSHEGDKGSQQSTEKICILQSTAFADDENSARSALASLATNADGIHSRLLEKHEYEDISLLALLDETDSYSLPWHYAADNMWTDAAPQALTTEIVEQMATMPSDMTSVIFLLRPHAGQGPESDLPVLGEIYFLCFNVWTDPGQSEINIEWRNKIMSLAMPYSKGHYINEADFLATPSRAKNSFRAGGWEKLKAVREKYDPNHVFQTQLH